MGALSSPRGLTCARSTFARPQTFSVSTPRSCAKGPKQGTFQGPRWAAHGCSWMRTLPHTYARSMVPLGKRCK